MDILIKRLASLSCLLQGDLTTFPYMTKMKNIYFGQFRFNNQSPWAWGGGV